MSPLLIVIIPASQAISCQSPLASLAKDASGDWHDIACDAGMITINNGDMLALATDNYFPSTTHRVTNPDQIENVSRYSMPMFLHPHPEAPLAEGVTADDYLQQRLREIGLKS